MPVEPSNTERLIAEYEDGVHVVGAGDDTYWPDEYVAELVIALSDIAAARAADAEEIARLRQDVANRDSRLRADIELMNIAGIDGPGAEKALADHDAELLRRAERAELLNQITQQEFRSAGAVRAERDALAQQIAAVRALLPKWRDDVRGYPAEVYEPARYAKAAVQTCGKELEAALASPVTPEPQTITVTPESETNR